jgi:REP element-mobilizing transposase RayT
MARPLRIQFPGAFYHITNRGNDRKPIFKDDEDRQRFLEILAQSVTTYQVAVHAYVLMANHYHLLVETPLGNLSEFMRHFNITYTSHFNRRHHRSGHLFQGRYNSVLIDQEVYLAAVSKYIHLNPIKVGGIKNRPVKEQLIYLQDFPWSSLPGFVNVAKRSDFVDYRLVLADSGGDTVTGRKNYRRQLTETLTAGVPIKEKIVGQSILGEGDFVARIREKFVGTSKSRELPAIRQLQSYLGQKQILDLIVAETGKTMKEVLNSRGETRQLAMDLLYRYGGLKNQEIGVLMSIDYSTVSQGRKRLREKIAESPAMAAVVARVEKSLSAIKI